MLSFAITPGCDQRSASEAGDNLNEGKYIMYSSRSSNISEVFDLESQTITVISSSTKSIKKSVETSEFSGPLILCSNSEFYCLKSGIIVAVPRKEPFPQRWSVSGINCIINSQIVNKIAKISCSIKNNQETTFDFDYVNGIISYKRMCDKCEIDVYVRRSKFGLFGLR